QHELHGFVALVEVGSQQFHTGVTIQTQSQLSHVVGTDGETVKVLQELLGQNGVGRHFAHHDQAQAVFATSQAVRSQQVHNTLCLTQGTHEWHHDLDVGQTHFVAHFLQGFAFHLEAFCEVFGQVASHTAEAQHWVFFLGLVARTTHQLAVFVGLEVRQTHDDGLGVEGSGQSRNTFSQFFHEECTWAGVATSRRFHRLFQVAIHIGVVQNSFGVNRNVVVDDEFQTSQTHTIVRNLREVKSQLWVTHVHHDFQADLGHLAPADFFDLGFQQTVVNTAFVAFSTRHRHFLAFFQHVCGVVATDHGRDAQFASNNRRVAGTAATVGDNSRSQLHDGFPVRVRHVGHQHVAGFDQIHLGGVSHDTDFARTDLLTNGAACYQDF